MKLFQIVDSKGKPLKLFDCNDVPIENTFASKQEAKTYRQKVDGSLASWVSYGPDHHKYNPDHKPRNNKGNHPKQSGFTKKAKHGAYF